MKRYWHELSREEQERIIDEGITIGELMRKYKQPKWCTYTDALQGQMGCWSLVWGDIHSEEDCKGCDCYKEVENG